MAKSSEQTSLVSDVFGLQNVKEILQLVYPDLLQPATRQLGSNLKTIFEYLSIPLLRMKFAVAETKLQYKRRLQVLIAEMDKIPLEKQCAIPSSIAAPALDQLSIESDEDISSLFVKLLLSSSSTDTIGLVHPSFVGCIRNLSSDEAKVLKYLNEQRTIPFIKIRLQFNETEGLEKSPVLTGMETLPDLQFPQNIPMYVDNLVGLGIIAKGEGALSDVVKWYDPLFKMYAGTKERIQAEGHTDGKHYPVGFQLGFYNITSYGRLFLEACMKKSD